MSRMKAPVLLVGSVPGETAAEVLRTCGEGVGKYVSCLPDGEIGYRRVWIQFLAATVYHDHPALETIQRPKPIDGKESWFPQDYGDDSWLFKVKTGIDTVRFDHLGYANEAQKSYQDFCALRAAGVIPSGVKFQVSLPLTESATRAFLTNAHDFALLWSAYEEALGREITRIVEAIPADDLVIQWDVCVEVLALELQDRFGGSWQPTGDPFERYLQALTALAKHVPDQTLMGCHLCYGDLGHHHLVEPADLRLLVRMANAARTAVTRRIDYYHMPVPRNRDDAAYFAPLQDLNIGEAKLYLGLIHHTDGVDGALRRVRTARQSASGFGVATECGFGRRPPETIPQLLRIHREVAAAL
jgi:methionine synthase II (cobalamin-independent)